MEKKDSGLAELCTNMKSRLGNKVVIKFSYRTVLLLTIFTMFFKVSFMSGI